MRKLSEGIVTLAFVWGLFACGYKEGVINGGPQAYLYFSGFTNRVEVVVDDVPLELEEQVTSNDHYRIQPGEHLVEVKHNGQTLVKRQIYVTDGVTKEIRIPKPDTRLTNPE